MRYPTSGAWLAASLVVIVLAVTPARTFGAAAADVPTPNSLNTNDPNPLRDTAITARVFLPGASAPPKVSAPATRRVNIPFYASGPEWYKSGVFWFGKNKQGVPSQNYVDMRLSYSNLGLHIYANIVDYYLWFWDASDTSLPTHNLTDYDAIAIYLGANAGKPSAPQTSNYMFLSGFRDGPFSNSALHRRQARGTGSAWNPNWLGAWDDTVGMQWSCDPGLNSNACGIDFGWTSIFFIPWATLGLSGPPAAHTVWSLGVMLYDRDDKPMAGGVAPELWPETFNANNPATWGELHFGFATYTPPPATRGGVTTVRAASPTDNTVEDTWTGGGGLCSSGHEGGSEINHGDDTDLFVGTEGRPDHFPCYNKSYLRFSLNAIPPGKVIISATVTLHLWGSADPTQAYASFVHLYSIRDPWNEMTLHWNNAPMAWENVSSTWMDIYSKPVIEWPGDPYTWDASKAVAEAYARGQPLSVAIYGSDNAQHSSKYLMSSEKGDWAVNGLPVLHVTWGNP